MFVNYIDVKYTVHSSNYSILKALNSLPDTISYDCETRSIYTEDQQAEAKDALKNHYNELDLDDMKLCKVVANSSGLSHPSIIQTTHFIFGISKEETVICIADNPKTEALIMNWLVSTDRHFILWNAGFDMKIIHQRTGKMLKHYDDGQLLLKCYINHCDTWKAKVGLKDFMSQYYHPEWALDVDYNVPDLKDEKFIRYCAIDGAATYHAWELLQEVNYE